MTQRSLLDAIQHAKALVRQAGRPIVRIRMHPDDIQLLRERYLPDAPDIGLLRFTGVPVLSDDTQTPGSPEVEYAE